MKPAFNWPVVTLHRTYCYTCLKERMHEKALHDITNTWWQHCVKCGCNTVIDDKALAEIEATKVISIVDHNFY